MIVFALEPLVEFSFNPIEELVRADWMLFLLTPMMQAAKVINMFYKLS